MGMPNKTKVNNGVDLIGNQKEGGEEIMQQFKKLPAEGREDALRAIEQMEARRFGNCLTSVNHLPAQNLRAARIGG